MNMTKEDFKALEAVRPFLPSGAELEKMPEEARAIINNFDVVLLRLYRKGKQNTERTRVYMNEKRANDPTFGRSVKYREEHREREERREQIKNDVQELCNYFTFSVFDVEIKPGYYEGFYISVRFDRSYFWSDDEKEEAIKEAGIIRDLWTWAIDNTMCCEVWPGWCTSYKDYEESLKSIAEAYDEMLTAIKKVPVEAY